MYCLDCHKHHLVKQLLQLLLNALFESHVGQALRCCSFQEHFQVDRTPVFQKGRGSREIGLKSVTCVTLFFLGKGITVLFFQDSGNI